MIALRPKTDIADGMCGPDHRYEDSFSGVNMLPGILDRRRLGEP
jgi:hypothetical protein